MTVIDVKGLTKRFGNFLAVDNIDFEVFEGEIFGFLGANGAGKTTTIKMLIGLIPPTSGSIFVSGIDVIKFPEKVKPIIGYMSQKFSLYNDLTVEENIGFYGGIYNISKNRLKTIREELISKFELQEYRRTLTSELPLGIKQRLALGISLMHDPKIVFLDEPTSGADPISRRKFWEIIQNLSFQKVTVFVTTHYLEEAEYCSRISLIDTGKIIAIGKPTELKQKVFEFGLFEVDFGDLQKNISVLDKKIKFGKFVLFGSKLHFLSNLKNLNLDELSKILESSLGQKPIFIRKIIPTLEDVFVELIKKRKDA